MARADAAATAAAAAGAADAATNRPSDGLRGGGVSPAPFQNGVNIHAIDGRADPLPAGAFIADAAGRGDRLQGRFHGAGRLPALGTSGLTEKKPYGAVKLTGEGLHLAEELEARRDRLLLLFARRFGLSMDQSALAATLLLSGLNEESLALLEAASQTP